MKRYIPLIIAIVAFAVSECLSFYAPRRLDANMIPEFQRRLNLHEKTMNALLDNITIRISREKDSAQLILSRINRNNYELYHYSGGVLSAWCGCELLEPTLAYLDSQKCFFETDHGYYFKKSMQCGEEGDKTFALFKVRSKYPFDNDYLENRWNPTFDINSNSRIKLDAEGDVTLSHIYDRDKHYLFSIQTTETADLETLSALSIVKVVCILIWLVSVFYFIYEATIYIRLRWGSIITLISAMAMCVGAYVWSLMIEIPRYAMETVLFSPQVFAYDWWMPSLGYVILASALIFMLSILIVKCFRLHHLRQTIEALQDRNKMFFLLVLVSFILYFAANKFINLLVHHSSDLLLYVESIDISFGAGTKLFIITLLWLSYIVLLDGVYSPMARGISGKALGIILGIISLLITIPMDIFMSDYGHLLTVGFIGTHIIYYNLKLRRQRGIHFSNFVWFMFASALFLMCRIWALDVEKEKNNRELLMNNLAFELMREDDPVAENMLSDIETELKSDEKIRYLMAESEKKSNMEQELYSYLREEYFDGYFTRYNLQVIPCYGEQSTIQLTQNGLVYNCYNYFQDMIDVFGTRINRRSDFYCLDDNDGRASYFGIIKINNKEREERLYIELNKKPNTQEIGYLELLTNNRDRLDTRQLKGYSYAKYYDDQLSNSYGQYHYPRKFRLPAFANDSTEEYTFDWDGYNHLIYKMYDHQYVALSYPQLTISNMLGDYSFLLLYLLLASTIIFYVLRKHTNIIYVNMAIHERMQNILIFLSLMMFVLFCLITIYQAFLRNERRSRERMTIALQGMTVAMSAELQAMGYDGSDNSLASNEMDNIMHRLATQYNNDAHLYSKNGRLIGTSRRELFLNNLASNLMDGYAISELNYGGHEEHFQQERMGKMYYYSIYSTILNDNGEPIAYLNIPFFQDLKSQRKEMISTLLPMTNFYMLIIIMSVLASYFLASTIAKPLRKIKDSLSLIRLEKRNEKLNYPHKDEIGQLVEEYNRMIDELEHSAQKLAATERESTWRNMARQIAHEIKNPLTPMKLSVQYLLKSWDEGREDFDTFIHKVGKTLVEQIDQLSHVATQFSSLAKTPNGEAEIVDVVQKLETCVYLFQREPDVDITLHKHIDQANTLINPDQLTSVFNNLVKNAQQAKKAEDEEIKIDANISVENRKIIVTVKDNGKGIPEDIQDNIFKPNFTTKSTGMGLGLAIVNKIILDAQGSITFTSKEGEGTTFTITLPLKDTH